MGLISRSELDGTQLPSDATSSLLDDKIATTKDTFTNRTVVLPDRYSDVFGALLSYISGNEITVEYYQDVLLAVDAMTKDLSLSSTRHSTYRSFRLIHDFKFKLNGAINIDIDEETNEATVTGEGVTYPGFRPTVGDMFLYTMQDAQIGIFYLTHAQPLSLSHGAAYQIIFRMHAYANDDDLAKLNTMTTEEAYFDKERFMTGDVSLLSTTEYKNLKDLGNYRDALLTTYQHRFYDRNARTYLPPTGIYDPYLNEFMIQKIDTMSGYQIPEQIYPTMNDFNQTFWSMMIDDIHTDLSLLTSEWVKITKIPFALDVLATNVSNRSVVLLNHTDMSNFTEYVDSDLEVESEPYVLSSAFYAGTRDTMEPIEQILYDVLMSNEVSIESFITTFLETTFTNLTVDEQYYKVPIYIGMIDMLTYDIT